MHLKTLEISGFKSFADKTKIDFFPGMTGIVGPNGSGKSNISEAIRWVLGEQSAKSLRGSKMPDVIFAGASQRKPLNRAQVVMTLDNTDHYLKSDFTELAVSRTLYRSGESRYEINGEQCRLKDIVELFMDSGLGQDSFSIISQGSVESIFNSKPEDRRAIVEEVAGVFKYKKHKEKAERELDDTMAYLSRVSDIIAELEGRLQPLEEQSSLATDYLDQKGRFEVLDRTQLVRHVLANRKAKAQLDQEQSDHDRQVAQYVAAQATGRETIQHLKDKQQALTTEKDRLQTTRLTAVQTKTRLAGQLDLSSERAKHQAEQRQALAAERTTVEQQLESQRATLQAAETALAQQRMAVKQGETAVATLTAATDPQRLPTLRAQVETLRSDYFDARQAVSTLKNQLTYLDRDHRQARQQAAQAAEQLAPLQATLTQAQQALTAAKSAESQAQTALETAEATFREAAGQHTTLRDKYQQRQKQWLGALEVYQRAQTKQASLQAAERDYAGYYQGVRAILKQRDHFPGILGSVSELLTVPKDYSLAIEYALGSQVQQVVTVDEATAKAAVTYLRQHKAGRATFLPADTMRSRQIPAETRSQLTTMDGVVGIAAELVSIEKAAIPILQSLLGTTIVVDHLDHATTVARLTHHRFRIVTLQGELISTSGAVTGGQSRQKQGGVFAQQQELAALTTSIQAMKATLNKEEDLVKSAQQAVADCEESGRQLQEDIDARHADLRHAQDQVAAATTDFQQAQRAFQAVQTTAKRQANDETNFQAKHQALADQMAAETKRANEIEQQAATISQQIDTFATDQTANQQALADKREWLAAARERLRADQQAVAQAQAAVQATAARLATIASDETALSQATAAQPISREQLLNQQEKIEATLSQTEQAIATIEQQLGQVNDDLLAAETENQRVTGLLQLANDERQRVQVAAARLETTIDTQLNQLADRYHMGLDAAQRDLSPLPDEQLTTQLKLLKRGLDEIGEVNLGAIDEYQEVKQRYEFLTQQRDDLLTSRDQLQTTMAELDDEVVHRFKTSFEAIAAQFTATFKQMFGGGTAELVLTDPEHLLTTGIDIMAQPPGKRFQNMGLLSGGERSLTAITLLFAILQVRPVPFCILDEAEAALDPANVTRFARYINGFKATQFIVITHRKETMVHADTLYGVTMQESGVSKMVAVDLDDIAEKPA